MLSNTCMLVIQWATYETAVYTVFLGISQYKSCFTDSINLNLHRKVGHTWPAVFEKLKIFQPKLEIFRFLYRKILIFFLFFHAFGQNLAKMAKSCFMKLEIFLVWGDEFWNTQLLLIEYELTHLLSIVISL